MARPTPVALRPLVLLMLLALTFALGAFFYAAWHNNAVIQMPSPTIQPSPGPAGYACPPGTDPDQPGPADQARPARHYTTHAVTPSDWRAVIDSESRQLVLVSGLDVWAFDLCTNTWRQTASTIVDARALVYDPVDDLIMFVGPAEVLTYDVDADAVATVGDTPVVGTWQVDYDSVRGLIVARDERTSRMWTYDVRTGTWREISQAGDIPPTLDKCGMWGEQAMTYDGSQDRLVLYDPTMACRSFEGPAIFEFDLASATWQRQPDEAPHFGVFDWGGPLLQMAYDAAAKRSVVYSVDRLATYDAARHAWDALAVPVERVGTEYNHYRVAVAYDPVNDRTILVGTDMTAVDVVTDTAVVLVAGRSAAPTQTPRR